MSGEKRSGRLKQAARDLQQSYGCALLLGLAGILLIVASIVLQSIRN